MSDIFLAIDQGGQSSRVIAFDQRGRAIGSATVPVATTCTGPGRYEQDPEALVNSIVSAVEQVCATLPAGAGLRAGLATQRSSIACWDRTTGQALCPVLSWRDTRNGPWLAALDLDEKRVHDITGLRPSAHYGASKLRWCLDHCPTVAAALAEGRLAWGPLASFLVFRLTRERILAADPANASRTLLMDLDSHDWSDEMTDAFGLPHGALPPVVAESGPFGTLAPGGLSVPLVRCTGDQPAALFADGSPDPATVFVNAGTGAFVLQRALWPNPEDRLLTSVIRGDDGFWFALEGTVNGAGAALEAEARAQGVPDWTIAVEGRQPDMDLPLFLNGHSGLGSPWWRESFRSRFIGDGTLAARLTAVLESVVFMLTVNLQFISKRLERQASIRATGGVSLAAGFCQRLADLSCLPVERPTNIEATARGLAWLGSSHRDHWAPVATTSFRPRPNPALASRFDRWRACMDRALAGDDV